MEQNPFGISVKDGLRMLANNANMYARLLKSYAASPIYAELMDAVEKGDMPTAASKAHALKGVSANLCLTPVFEQIKLIEAQLKAGNVLAPDSADLATLKDLYAKTLESIQTIVADPTILNAFK